MEVPGNSSRNHKRFVKSVQNGISVSLGTSSGNERG